LLLEHPGTSPKSFTFIAATLADNQKLLELDPNYKANLLAMNRVERERLLNGNWKIKPTAGSYFPSHCVNTITAIPAGVRQWVRKWDLAATVPSELNPSPDATCGVLMGIQDNGKVVIADVINVRKDAYAVREIIKNVAGQDKARLYANNVNGVAVRQSIGLTTVIPIDPGQAGKAQAQSLIAYLAGHSVKGEKETGPKETRAEPFSAQWQAGNVDIVAGAWNKDYLNEMEMFPEGSHDDAVDASSGAFLELTTKVNDRLRWQALAS
jgi:predicted phage terminase large subunit-like protein